MKFALCKSRLCHKFIIAFARLETCSLYVKSGVNLTLSYVHCCVSVFAYIQIFIVVVVYAKQFWLGVV